ncbi:MAG: ABC transporter substrate-binding protein [Eubacterium sp.]
MHGGDCLWERKRKLELIIVVIVLILAVLVTSLLVDGLNRQRRKNEDRQQEEETITLELVYAYQNPQWNSAIEDCVKSFHENYPNIHINYKVNYEQKVYDDLLTEKIARNELGDIVQLKTPLRYAESDTLGEISESVANQVTSVYTYIGKTYGVGAVQATSGILYNKKLFNKYHLSEPKTWNDFLRICRILKANGVTPIGVGGSDLWHMEYWVNHFFRVDVLSGNENWLQDCTAGKVSWEEKEPKQMMHHLSELFSGGYVNEDWRTTTDGNLPYKMTEGEVAMIYTGPWTAQSISQLDEDMELGWFYVPDDDGMIYAGENLDTFLVCHKGMCGG